MQGQSRLWLVVPLFFYLGGTIASSSCGDSEFEQIWKEHDYKEEQFLVRGVIKSINVYDDSLRTTLKDVVVENKDRQYQCSDIFVYTDTNDDALFPGDIVEVYGEISRLNKAANPGQFDARKYYNALNIRYSLNASLCEVLEHSDRNIPTVLYKLRTYLQSKLKLVSSEKDYEILTAMLLGDKSELGDEIEALYQLNGIAHILTISGLHISMIGSGLYKLLRRLGGGFAVSSVIAGTVICLYGIMTGLGTSSLRAIIMFIIMLIADCIGKSYDMTSSVCLAGILVLCEYPLMIYQFAFQMSVVCILAISLVAPIVCKFLCIKNRFLGTAVTGCIIQWCTIPILLYHMYTYPIFSVLINLVVIPFVELVMISGLSGLISALINQKISAFLLGTSHYILMFYELLCRFVLGLKHSLLISGQPKLWQIAVYYIVLFVVLSYISHKNSKDKIQADNKQNKLKNKPKSRFMPFWKRRNVLKHNEVFVKNSALPENNGVDIQSILLRYIIVAVTIAVSIFILVANGSDEMTVVVADVGQGDSILIKTPAGITALVDCGSSDIKDIGGKRIIPMLNFYGIDSVDYVFLSHGDLDHINGIIDLIEAKRVKNIILPKDDNNLEFLEITASAKSYDVPVLYVGAGDKITSDDVSFICLHPSVGNSTEDKNSSSMVLKLEYKNFSMLFTGDLDMLGEKQVIDAAAMYNISIDCDVLKVGHHGSKYSSGEEFLAYVMPETAVISCSENNTYGHPSSEVLERLRNINSDTYATKDFGAVMVSTDGLDYNVEVFCEE